MFVAFTVIVTITMDYKKTNRIMPMPESLVLAKKNMKANEIVQSEWYCHCCSYKNKPELDHCKVCGRPESYGQDGYPLPFHNYHNYSHSNSYSNNHNNSHSNSDYSNSNVYRPSQIINILDSVHDADDSNYTALLAACANGNYTICKELLKYKSKVDTLTTDGLSALHLAVFANSLECVLLLLQHNAEVNAISFTEKNTPLHMACESGNAGIVQALIDCNADVHLRNILLRTPLHCAAISGRTDIGKELP